MLMIRYTTNAIYARHALQCRLPRNAASRYRVPAAMRMQEYRRVLKEACRAACAWRNVYGNVCESAEAVARMSPRRRSDAAALQTPSRAENDGVMRASEDA